MRHLVFAVIEDEFDTDFASEEFQGKLNKIEVATYDRVTFVNLVDLGNNLGLDEALTLVQFEQAIREKMTSIDDTLSQYTHDVVIFVDQNINILLPLVSNPQYSTSLSKLFGIDGNETLKKRLNEMLNRQHRNASVVMQSTGWYIVGVFLQILVKEKKLSVQNVLPILASSVGDSFLEHSSVTGNFGDALRFPWNNNILWVKHSIKLSQSELGFQPKEQFEFEGFSVFQGRDKWHLDAHNWENLISRAVSFAEIRDISWVRDVMDEVSHILDDGRWHPISDSDVANFRKDFPRTFELACRIGKQVWPAEHAKGDNTANISGIKGLLGVRADTNPSRRYRHVFTSKIFAAFFEVVQFREVKVECCETLNPQIVPAMQPLLPFLMCFGRIVLSLDAEGARLLLENDHVTLRLPPSARSFLAAEVRNAIDTACGISHADLIAKVEGPRLSLCDVTAYLCKSYNLAVTVCDEPGAPELSFTSK